jgi:Tfp pilus assembly protein PilO
MNINFSKSTTIGVPGQLKPYRNPFVEITLLIIVCALFGWFIILPKKAQVSAQKAQLAVVTEDESQTAAKLATLQRLVDTLEASGPKVADLDYAMPLDGNTLKLHFLIENLAESVGATVGDISLAGNSEAFAAGDKKLLADFYGPTRTLQKISGSVYVIGSYEQLQAFLGNLETSGRLIDISDIGLDSSSDNGLNMRLTITAYYLAP